MTYDLVRLGDVAQINPRLARDINLQADTQVRFVPMAAVDEVSGTIADIQHRTFSEVSKGYTNFQSGDVLFAKITPCMQNGKSAIFDDENTLVGFGSTEFYVIRAGERILPRFLYHLVRLETFRDQAKAHFTGTAGQQRVPRDFLENYSLLLPPLDEQQRIVDILDRAANIQRLRQAADEKLKQIIPALFVDMFGDPATNPKGWPTDKLGFYVEEFRYGTSQKSGPTGLPVLRIPNVISDTLDTGEIKLVELNEAEQRRLMLRDGDILFVRTNGNPDYVGRSAVFNRTALDQAGFDGSECVYASYLIRARLNADLCPHFLQAYLTTAEGRKFLRERSKTSAGQYNINIDGLSSLPVYVPPIELQNQFREKLDALRSTGSLAGKASVAAQLIAASLSAQLCSP